MVKTTTDKKAKEGNPPNKEAMDVAEAEKKRQEEERRREKQRDKNNAGAIALGIVSCMVAAGAGLATYLQYLQAHRVEAAAVISRFVDQGLSARKTPFCYRYANSLSDDDLRRVYRDIPESIPVDPRHSTNLTQCLLLEGVLKKLDGKNLEEFAFKTQLKLNSYETAFRALRDGSANEGDICDTVWPSLDQDVDDFVTRVQNINPRPEKFADMSKNWSAILQFLKDAPCSDQPT